MSVIFHGIEVGPSRFSGIPLRGPHHDKTGSPPIARCPAPRGVSSFAFFFAPILYDLGEYWWDELPIYGNTYEAAKADESLKDHWVDLPAQSFIPPRTMIPFFAKYVEDWDWCCFHGFEDRPGEEYNVLRKRIDSLRHDFGRLFEFVDIRFLNVDGAFWQMYTKNKAYLARVQHHVQRIKGAFVRDPTCK